MRAALRGSGIRLHVEGADAPRPLALLAREAACVALLPFQLPRAEEADVNSAVPDDAPPLAGELLAASQSRTVAK